jgi:hypothetical protein
MATGMDALVDFVLTEVALCGTQGMYCRFRVHQFESLHHPLSLLLHLQNLSDFQTSHSLWGSKAVTRPLNVFVLVHCHLTPVSHFITLIAHTDL